ncbi:UDP-N-acetylmuramate dehydrogenase [sulfur-oxidizing endosymbiont of Gigantopelta aegis]|uniref:UDP-N-acetylmuramate dehydrogenase n=1 Tax=sulfur-oxidizing endosymbiont of Gigantopelta aegis TaxID=2794934 RepID=UPI0018DB13AF|nr:UDP-N-acetylmuramate dehydrogenase [sulfur-oxidizing endosymbiont of Gigantopelta aegis]
MIKTALQTLLTQAVEDDKLHGSLKCNEVLSRYTTWRIGGEAECFYQPESEADLQMIFKLLPQATPIVWIGLGSNLLVRDGGVKGLIIYTNGVLNSLQIDCDNDDSQSCFITAQAGVACAIFARKSAHKNINGAEFLSGIPGTIGGALAMNAGAFGGETWRHVETVKMINQVGEIICRTVDEFDVSYRAVDQRGRNEWFISANFKFPQDEQGLLASKEKIKQLLKKRAETQPTKQANAGSVFKNPEGDFAARLIESCELKGFSINDAQVSPKHANFIINKAKARAIDVETLIVKIQETVFAKHQIKLQTEVKVIGEKKAEYER